MIWHKLHFKWAFELETNVEVFITPIEIISLLLIVYTLHFFCQKLIITT
jgi:hypothetical protein